MYISKVFRMIPHTPHHDPLPLRQQKCRADLLFQILNLMKGAPVWINVMSCSWPREVWAKTAQVGQFFQPWQPGSGKIYHSFLLGVFPTQKGESPHPTITKQWDPSDYPHISSGSAVSCYSQASPKDPQWHSQLDPPGQRSDQGAEMNNGMGRMFQVHSPEKRGKKPVLLRPTRSVASGNWCAS